MSRKIYCIERTAKLYVVAESVEDAQECVEWDEIVLEDHEDGDPVEVPYIDTSWGRRLFLDDLEEAEA